MFLATEISHAFSLGYYSYVRVKDSGSEFNSKIYTTHLNLWTFQKIWICRRYHVSDIFRFLDDGNPVEVTSTLFVRGCAATLLENLPIRRLKLAHQ